MQERFGYRILECNRCKYRWQYTNDRNDAVCSKCFPLRSCNKCSYIWRYTGSRKYFCCPNCMSSARHPLSDRCEPLVIKDTKESK